MNKLFASAALALSVFAFSSTGLVSPIDGAYAADNSCKRNYNITTRTNCDSHFKKRYILQETFPQATVLLRRADPGGSGGGGGEGGGAGNR